MGMSWAEHTLEIEAPVDTCFEAITDYESFPSWQNAVDSVEVLDRTRDGIGRRVKLFVDAKVRKIDYVLDYSYERPHRIEWDFVEGNGMRDVDGAYTLEEAGPNRTRATYKLGADPEIPVPGPVARRVHKQLVKRSVEDLKREAERRRGEAGVPPKRQRARDWRPRAARDPGAPPGGGEPPEPEPALAAVTSLPGAVIGRAMGLARGAAETALEFGRGAAETALEVGRDVADRVDRRLSGSEEEDEEER